MSEYICPLHGVVKSSRICAKCNRMMKTAPAPETMTADERAAELERWFGIKVLTVEWQTFVARCQALVGRGIYTHEFAYNQEGLIEEARGTKAPPQFLDEILASLPDSVHVISIDMDETQTKEFSDN